MIDEAWLDCFETYNISVAISLDGPAHIHDVHRRSFQGTGTHAAVERVVRTAPRVGRVLAASGLTCAYWSVHPKAAPAPIKAAGAPPIVVIGGTGDPATPYAWSVALAKELSSGVLLTRTGEGHGSYGFGTPCIDTPVNAYLLDLTPPAKGTVCK